MKKIISLALCLCMIFTMAVVSFAADETVMIVSYKTMKGEFADEYSVFHTGWTDAIKKSMDGNYKDVTVTLQKDWLSAWDGQFTPDFRNKEGFNWDAINFPSGSNITLDLNGHKLTDSLPLGNITAKLCASTKAQTLLSKTEPSPVVSAATVPAVSICTAVT